MKRPPLDLIAERAGVSLATASRVINSGPNVAPATRQRVLEAMHALSPPGMKNVTYSIALIIPDGENQYFTDVALQLDRECERRAASLMVASSDGRADREMHLLQRFLEIEVDGLLFIPAGAGDGMALLSVLDNPQVPPIVAFDRAVDPLDTVTVDPRKGTIAAIDYLVTARGHERIGYIKGLAGTRTAVDRFDAFNEALSLHRLAIRDEWVFEGDYKVAGGLRAADNFLELLKLPVEERPSALLAANDLMAMGVIQRLTEAGLSLPRDLSIVGFDGIPAASWVTPKLATIEQPTDRLVKTALNLLIERINRGSDWRADKARSISLDSEFRVGDLNSSVADYRATPGLRVVTGGRKASAS
jgi:LacI family transcriptional regulator